MTGLGRGACGGELKLLTLPDEDGNGLGSWACGGVIGRGLDTRINSKEPESPLEGTCKSL